MRKRKLTADQLEAYVNQYAINSLRDVADQDYIAGRMAYRLELDVQFRWCALQALEKYLKAILVFNRTSAKSLGHDVTAALKRVSGVQDLGFTVPGDVEKFIEYLSKYGPDRYLSHPTFMKEEALLVLDKSVWCVRRFCTVLRIVHDINGIPTSMFEARRSKILDPYWEENYHRFKIPDGYLERVIHEKSAGYRALIWKNFFYGARAKKQICNLRIRISSNNPTHHLRPEIFPILDGLVDFPTDIRKHYRAALIDENGDPPERV